VQSYYTFIALDIANQRTRELEQRHLLDIARASDPEHQRSIRRSAGALIASLSRASGRLARRLDDNANVSGALIGRSIAAPCTCADGQS
jgi:GTP1/Obg family GTP-binding protein